MSKTCPKCDRSEPAVGFGSNKSRKDGKQVYCLECLREYRRQHYRENKPAHYKRNHKTHADLREMVVLAKSVPCGDCGKSYPGEPWLMEFDHRDPSEKCGVIDRLLKNGSKKRLLEEITKCDVLCLVCHRRRTAAMLNWQSNRYGSVV